MKYRKKPVEIEAIQYLKEENISTILDFCGDCLTYNEAKNEYGIETLEGTMTLNKYDYVIKGVKGEFYPCKPDIFELTYEKI